MRMNTFSAAVPARHSSPLIYAQQRAKHDAWLQRFYLRRVLSGKAKKCDAEMSIRCGLASAAWSEESRMYMGFGGPIRARYIGPNARLKEQTALVHFNFNKCTAQFDDTSSPLGYGWHPFDASDFRVL